MTAIPPSAQGAKKQPYANLKVVDLPVIRKKENLIAVYSDAGKPVLATLSSADFFEKLKLERKSAAFFAYQSYGVVTKRASLADLNFKAAHEFPVDKETCTEFRIGYDTRVQVKGSLKDVLKTLQDFAEGDENYLDVTGDLKALLLPINTAEKDKAESEAKAKYEAYRKAAESKSAGLVDKFMTKMRQVMPKKKANPPQSAVSKPQSPKS